jgi:hypothetical protein
VHVSNETTWRIGTAELVFTGAPPLLTGEVELINEGDEKVVPKHLEAHFDRDQGIHADLRVPVRIAPHSRMRVRAQCVVDRETPPGTYHGSVRHGPHQTPATVHVYERDATSVHPARLRFAGSPGEHIELHVSLTNHGNVTHTLSKHGVIFFEEANWVGRSLVFALRETGAEDGIQRYLDRVVKELVESMASTTAVTIAAPKPTLAPGSTEQITLTFDLPERLTKGRTYGTWLTIAGTTITFELLCNGSAKSTIRRTK